MDQEILPSLSVEAVFGDLPDLARDGRFWQARCPFHGEEGAGAFAIDPERLEWNCFLGCGGGGPVQYLERWRRLSWVDAARELARMAGVDPEVLEPDSRHWRPADFRRHQQMEYRSSLLGLLEVYTHSLLWSRAGQTLRAFLARRKGFDETALDRLPIGLYTTPEDLWEYLQKARRDLVKLKKWGLFEPCWSGRLVGFWKDGRGRRVNMWGWAAHEKEESLLFRAGDTLGSAENLFHLERAAQERCRHLLLVEGPMRALLLDSLGARDPFPVAFLGELNHAQVRTLEDFLAGGGDLTLCLEYNPATQGTARDRQARTLQYLKSCHFPLYSVDPACLAQGTTARGRVRLEEYLLQESSSAARLARLQALLEQREAAVSLEKEEGQAWEWPGVSDLVRGLVAGGPGDGARHSPTAVLDPIFRIAEEVGRRLANGFLKALPGRLLGQEGSPLALENGVSQAHPLPQLPLPLPFSVDRLQQQGLRERGCWPELDSLGVRFTAGEVALVAGRTGHGKTSFLLSLLVEWLAGGARERFLFCSLQESEVRLYHRLLAIVSSLGGEGRSVGEIGRLLAAGSNRTSLPEPLSSAREELRRWEPQLVLLHQPEWEVESFRSWVRQATGGAAPGAVFIDHLRPEAVRRGEIDGPLRTLAVECRAPLLIGVEIATGCQPEGAVGRPSLGDLEAGGMEQEADLVLALLNRQAGSRAAGQAPFEVGCLKNRYGPAGNWAALELEPACGRVGSLKGGPAPADPVQRPRPPESRPQPVDPDPSEAPAPVEPSPS